MRTGTFYEISVSKYGVFVFATDSTFRSTHSTDVKRVLLLFAEKFPKSEGYSVKLEIRYSQAMEPSKSHPELCKIVDQNWGKEWRDNGTCGK